MSSRQGTKDRFVAQRGHSPDIVPGGALTWGDERLVTQGMSLEGLRERLKDCEGVLAWMQMQDAGECGYETEDSQRAYLPSTNMLLMSL